MSERGLSPEPEASRAGRLLPELTLAGITLLWGGTFLATRHGLDYAAPLWFVALRFGTAGIVLAACSSPVLRRGIGRRDLVAGVVVGLSMVAVFAFQTMGLVLIESSRSAFITALYVPLVPLIELVFLRRVPRPMVWAGIAMAFAGLVLLAGPEQVRALRLGRGEVLTLLGAIAAAVQIVLIGRFAREVDPRRTAIVQVTIVAAAAAMIAVLVGEPVPAPSLPLAASAGGLGVASALIQVAMNWGQRSVAPSRATLIYCGEPVWAGVFGRLAGERLPGLAIAGAALIVGAVVVGEVRMPSRRPFGRPPRPS